MKTTKAREVRCCTLIDIQDVLGPTIHELERLLVHEALSDDARRTIVRAIAALEKGSDCLGRVMGVV